MGVVRGVVLCGDMPPPYAGSGTEPTQSAAHRLLRDEDAAEHDDHGSEVHGRERLLEQHDSEQGAHDGVHEPHDGYGTGIHAREATEPQGVAERRADEAEVDEGGQGGEIDGRRRALDEECDRHEEQPTDDELPRRRHEDVVSRRPPLDEDEPDGGGDDRPHRSGEPQWVHRDRPVVLPHERRDACNTDDRGDEGEAGLAFPDEEEGRRHDDEGTQRGERRRETTGQAEGRDVEQAEEDAVVEGPEDE